MHLRTFPDHQKHFSKKNFLTVRSAEKCVLMHLRILPDHQKLSFKKDIFYHLEWLKLCFNAFAYISRPPESFLQKRFFWPSGVLKNVFWYICAYFQTTRNIFKKEDIFYRLKWLKLCFDAFAHTSRPPETFLKKKIFFTV